VSGPYFEGLYHRAPLAGRWLDTSDDAVGAEVAAVVSHSFWLRTSGGDPAFVGRLLEWNGNRALRVVGVAPVGVDYPIGTEIWAPALAVFDGRAGRFDARSRRFAQFELIGRLRPGVTAERARAELAVVHRRMADTFPAEIRSMEVTVAPFIETVLGDDRPLLFALFVGGGLVFGVAGINVAALLLMRASARDLDRAVRAALGASRARLMQHALLESAVFAVAGAVAGLLVGRALIAWLPQIAPDDLPRLDRASLGLPAVLFAAGIAAAWLLLFGSVPVWGRRGAASLAALGRTFPGAHRSRGLLLFASLQVGAAVLLAIAAGLFVRSFSQLSGLDRGVAVDQVYLATLLLPEDQRRDRTVQTRFHKRVVEDLSAVPGVTSVSPVHLGPGTGTLGLSAPMLFEGQAAEEARTNPWSTWEPVLPEYFRTLGVPIVQGRGFTADDRRDTAPVAVVSESVARRYWPNVDPVGRRVQFANGPDWPWVTIVGVARDTRYRELRKTWMTVYFPADQFFFFQPGSILVRTQLTAEALRAELTPRVAQAMPGAMVDRVDRGGRRPARERARPRAAVAVAATFALAAIGLALVGIYGVLSYDVRQRRRELAIRAALGASPPRLARHVAGRGALAASTGALIGVSVAAVLTRGLSAVLFEVSPLDGVVYFLVLLAMPLLVVSAAWAPARTAARTDAASTLRAE
jgi:predicted permease